MSKAAELLKDERKFLADGGYSHELLVTPDDDESRNWNRTQKSLRSVVEHVIGLNHNFQVCTSKFKQSPELQAMAVMAVWYLVAWKVAETPLRTRY